MYVLLHRIYLPQNGTYKNPISTPHKKNGFRIYLNLFENILESKNKNKNMRKLYLLHRIFFSKVFYVTSITTKTHQKNKTKKSNLSVTKIKIKENGE